MKPTHSILQTLDHVHTTLWTILYTIVKESFDLTCTNHTRINFADSRTMGRGSGASEPQLKAGGEEQTTLTHMDRHGAASIGSPSDFIHLFRLFFMPRPSHIFICILSFRLIYLNCFGIFFLWKESFGSLADPDSGHRIMNIE